MHAPPQVASVRLNEQNIAEIKLVEMPVTAIKLLFKDSSAVEPQAVHRYMTTRPGKVCSFVVLRALLSLSISVASK